MIETELEYVVDGKPLVGSLFEPEGAAGAPAALIAHEAPGLSEHSRAAARRMAARGFVAFAYDYQGDGIARTDPDDVMAQVRSWIADPAPVTRRSIAAFDLLRSRAGVDPARVIGLGYCYGGAALLDLARTGVTLAAAVGFHAALPRGDSARSRAITARILMLTGGQDPFVPASDRHAFEAEMAEAGVDWQLTLYGRAQHSFTNPAADGLGIEGVAYDREADTASWTSMLAFVGATIGPAGAETL